MFTERIVQLLLLFVGELAYLKIADKFNIIDRPNQRSSHKKNVLRGGGIIFLLSVWIFAVITPASYTLFVLGMTLASIVAFIDDIHSLSPTLRFLVQIIGMFLLSVEAGMLVGSNIWFLLPHCF